jgi:hypothetical protein
MVYNVIFFTKSADLLTRLGYQVFKVLNKNFNFTQIDFNPKFRPDHFQKINLSPSPKKVAAVEKAAEFQIF